MKWKPIDIMALLVTLCLVGVALMASFSVSIMGSPVPESRKELLLIIVSALAFIVTKYATDKTGGMNRPDDAPPADKKSDVTDPANKDKDKE